MAKIGVRVNIDCSKIDKARLFKGKKGTYLDATCFIDIDEADQYGQNGMITQDVTKEERESGTKGPILGNVSVFYRDGLQEDYRGHDGSNQKNPTYGNDQSPGGAMDDDSEIPF